MWCRSLAPAAPVTSSPFSRTIAASPKNTRAWRYIVPGHLQFDPAGELGQIEIEMPSNGDVTEAQCLQRYRRFWTAAAFKKLLDDIAAGVVLFELDLRLAHEGNLVRQVIQQYSHALMLRRMDSRSGCRFYFVQDGDAGIGEAFLATFAPEVQAGRVDVATVAIDKYQVKDVPDVLDAQERRNLRNDLGFSAHLLDCLPEKVFNEEIDREIAKRVARHRLNMPFAWPYHRESEPSPVVGFKSDRSELTTKRCARLMRIAAAHATSYFHKSRRMFDPLPVLFSTLSSNGLTQDPQFLYKPEMLIKITEICRLHNDWPSTRRRRRRPQ